MEILFAQFFPDMLDWIYLGTVGGLLDQADVGRNDQFARAMPACPIHLHHQEGVGKRLGEMCQEEVHHCRIGRRQHEGAEHPGGWHHRCKDVDCLTDELTRSRWTDSRRSPTAFGTREPSEAAFVLCQDQDGALIGSWPVCQSCLNLRRKVFLNASCSSWLAFGCLARGTSLRQPERLSRR